MQPFIPDSYGELIERAGSYHNYTLPAVDQLLKQTGFQYLALHAEAPMFYVADYSQNKYLYIDPSCKKILGYEIDFLQQSGPLYYTGLWHPQDFKIFSDRILPESLKFLRNKPLEEYPDYSFSFNYRIKTLNGKYITVLQRSTYFLAAADGQPLGAAGFTVDISHFKENTHIIHTIEKIDRNFSSLSKEPLYKRIYYPDKTIALLSSREQEVLQLIYKGDASKEIAYKLNISIHTIANHRKNMLQKTNCRNTAELINYAVINGLL